MRIDLAPIEHIDVPPRLRPVDARKVQILADSIAAIGLQQPITLWAVPDGPFQLVAGAHRLEACRSLGLVAINAVFTDADEIDRQLWEIDENLMRSELTPTQQAEHLAKRKELWEARENSGRNPPTPKKFAASTEDVTGVSKRRINEAVARAEKIDEAIRDQIRGTDLDKGVVLDELARTPRENQTETLERIRERSSNGRHHDHEDQYRVLLSRLFRAWRDCPKDYQERFIQALRDEGRI